MQITHPSSQRSVDSVLSARGASLVARRATSSDPARPISPSERKLIGRSPQIQRSVETCIQVARTDATVLLLGETGTGKELLARIIHEHSHRRGDFVAVNCGAITESLLESELFGHEKGAFTGATSAKDGLFRRAEGGTILLDEIGCLPLNAQHSLLRVLQEGCVRPVGSSREVPIDVRVIAATSTPLLEAMERHEFREDLFYRLDVIRVVVPPLRGRRQDLRPLFDHFCRQHAEHHALTPPRVTPDFERVLLSYDWPGNVRQLENLTERLVLTCAGRELGADDLMRHVASPPSRAAHTASSPASRPEEPPTHVDLSANLRDYLDRCEANYLEAALERTGGRVQAAARLAGLSRRTLSRRISKYGIEVSSLRGAGWSD